jgi:hypothetical protein
MLRKKASGFHERRKLRGDLELSLKKSKELPPNALEVSQAVMAFQAKGGMIHQLKDEIVPPNLRVKTKYE